MESRHADPFAGPAYDPDLPWEERLRARLANVREERERFLASAQRELAARDAVVAELEALLDPEAARRRVGLMPAGANGTAPPPAEE
jgi:hypothetical protein